MSPTPLLAAVGLAWSPPNKAEVLRKVDFELASGQMVWLAGPSGAGKSTLLRMLNGLLTPSRGEVRFQGRPLADYPPPKLRRQVALVAQQPLMVAETVRAELTLSFDFRAAAGSQAPDDASLRAGLDGLGLAQLGLDDPVADLSVGQKQRLTFLRALLTKPEVLLLDEPLAGLDPESRTQLEQAAQDFAVGGGGVIMVSHLPPGGAGDSQRAVVLRDGVVSEARP